MLQPKRAKYRRQMRGIMKGPASRGTSLAFGDYGLKVMENCWLTARQLESARKTISHFTKRGGRLWIRIFPDKPVTKRPPEIRMGGGKGPVDHYAAVVRPGRIIFEIGGVTRIVAEEALLRASQKLPIRTKFIGEK
ncbi:MAG: 50S ribosomal protein L16 [Patescibacteria group bacterium]